MNQAPQMAFSHIGLYVIDMAAMVSFYTQVLGFSVTDEARIRGADVVFLSRNPDEHHQIVLVPGRSPQSPSTVNQISFRVASLSELRRLHGLAVALKLAGLNPTNHGGSWSVYFLDPEGNRIELFAQTPWYMPPISAPLDFGLSDEEIYSATQAMVRATAGSMKRAEWRNQLHQRLSQEGTLEHRHRAVGEPSLSGSADDHSQERSGMDQTSNDVSTPVAGQFALPWGATFALGDRVRKKSGAAWQGQVVGWYSTKLTPEGYAVESESHPGSVQIYPVAALERVGSP